MDIRVEHQCLLEWLCKTRGSWDHSLLNLSALSAVLLLLDPKPETLIQPVKWEFSLATTVFSFTCLAVVSVHLVVFLLSSSTFFPHSWRYCSCHSTFVFPSSYVTGSLQIYHEGHGFHLWDIVMLQSLFTADLMIHKDLGNNAFYSTAYSSTFFFPVSKNDGWTSLRQLSGLNKLCVRAGDRYHACRVWALAIYRLWLLLSRNWSSFIAAI